MIEAAISKRLQRAKKKAQRDLEALGYKTLPTNCKPVNMLAIREGEVRVIHICIDNISDENILRLKKIPRSEHVIREVWLREHGETGFRITKV